jgi:hypothetical protein
MTQFRQKLTIIFEIDTEHDGDGEDKLPVRALTGKHRKEFMFAFGVGAPNPAKFLVQASASQIFLDHRIHPPAGTAHIASRNARHSRP